MIGGSTQGCWERGGSQCPALLETVCLLAKSIYENVAWGARINSYRGNLDELVERSLRQAALWDEVKDKLPQSGYSLSGGQHQRLCIARAIAIRPDLILMDEPASALDPIATLKIEDLMRELARDYTFVVVTHNMQQIARVSDFTAFFVMDADRAGYLVEEGPTKELFASPQDRRTEDYITGRFGWRRCEAAGYRDRS